MSNSNLVTRGNKSSLNQEKSRGLEEIFCKGVSCELKSRGDMEKDEFRAKFGPPLESLLSQGPLAQIRGKGSVGHSGGDPGGRRSKIGPDVHALIQRMQEMGVVPADGTSRVKVQVPPPKYAKKDVDENRNSDSISSSPRGGICETPPPSTGPMTRGSKLGELSIGPEDSGVLEHFDSKSTTTTTASQMKGKGSEKTEKTEKSEFERKSPYSVRLQSSSQYKKASRPTTTATTNNTQQQRNRSSSETILEPKKKTETSKNRGKTPKSTSSQGYLAQTKASQGKIGNFPEVKVQGDKFGLVVRKMGDAVGGSGEKEGGKIEGLKENFAIFSKFGDSTSDGKQITLSNCDKWMKQAGVIDGKKFTTTDTSIAFKKLAKNAKKINFEDFNKYVEGLAAAKKVEPKEILDKMAKCGAPTLSSATKATSKGVVERLTDTSKYTGSHKERFDASGKGKGMAGRKDIADTSGYVASFKEKLVIDKKA